VSLFCPSQPNLLTRFQPKGSKQINPYRSAAQRARRQRELAANIEDLLQTHGGENIRSRAQILRRKVEEGERCLESNPDCGMYACHLSLFDSPFCRQILHKLWTEHLIMNMM
jgi:hypothetical protein